MHEYPDSAATDDTSDALTSDTDPQSPTSRTTPERIRLRHLASSLFVFSLFLLLWFTLYFGVQVFLLVFAGILFGVLLRFMGNWLATKLPLSGKWCVLVTAVGLLLIVGGAGWLLMPSLTQQVDKLSTTLPRSVEKMQQVLSQHSWGRFLLAKAPEPGQMVTGQGNVASAVSNAFRITTAVIGNFVAILFLGLFFAISPSTYTNGIIALLPRKREKRAREVFGELETTLARWLFGQLITMSIVAVLTTLGLWALGIDLALVLGLLAGALAFIPNIGPVIGAVPAVMIGLLNSPTQALWIVLLYLVVQTVESYIFYPLIQKRMVSLPPALILAVQFLMGVTLGTLALALATPLAAVTLVLVKMLYVQDVLGKTVHLPGEHDENAD